MTIKTSNPILSFVWQSHEITHSVVDAARQTSVGAIFDVGTDPGENIAKALNISGAKEIRIPVADFMSPALNEFLRTSHVNTLWIEYYPALAAIAPEAFLKRLHALSPRVECIPISGDVGFLTLCLQSDLRPQRIALKGAEAAGFVSTETTGILFDTLKNAAGRRTEKPGLIIWGGLATAEAAAAFLCSGARGIIFESLHWQTDLTSINPDRRKRLSGLRPEHTKLVARNLGAPCRLFDRGNSLAVKELNQYIDAQFACEVSDHVRHRFARKVAEGVKPALGSDLGRGDLVFIGPEAAFAETFARRFGRSTRMAIEAFLEEVTRCCRQAPRKLDEFKENSTARSLGTRYPFIQGAMSWISDMPEFAVAVSEAGAMPTVALGLQSRTEIEQNLEALIEVMGDNPYAVNLIALPENPHLEQQLAWIEQNRPPFAVIAAGPPSYAARLQAKGIQTIYVTSSEGLIRIALESGVRFVVLEGNEAGGHVGEHSTLTLAQIALEFKRREPELFRDRHVVLAGGIFNRNTVFRAAMLGATAVQMGTAYLATREIVATGALSPLYQQLIIDSEPGMTEISGESIGLRVRSLKTPIIDDICTLEREWAAGQHDESSFRHRLEAMSANSLLIAARGIESPNGRVLDEKTCFREGQFMCGAIAGAIESVPTIAEFHRALAEDPVELTLPDKKEPPSVSVIHRKGGDRIAVTGMALVNSLGNSPKEIWEASLAMKSGITTIPGSRWNHDLYYDPDPRTQGKSYCNVGAFQHIDISRKVLDIAPQDFRSMADSTRLTLWLAQEVIRDSGILDSDIPRDRISVLISQNSGEAANTLTDLVLDVNSHQILQSMQDVVPLTPDQVAAVREKIHSGRLRVDDTTLLGRLNCTAGGFVSKRYGLQGPSYSVSAACATGLVAIYSAIQMIRNGIIDAAVVGGGEEQLHPSHFLEFSALKALAMLSGVECPVQETSRPFDANRDGMVLGEGGGMIVIERESVAKQRGACIHAYITGLGASNNDQGLVEPLAETQIIALRSSYRDAGYGLDHVDLVECHATSTVQGDIEEVKSLLALKSSTRGTMLSSFKAQIGHTLGASGLNSLVRGVIAMQKGIFPPTPTYRSRDARIDFEAGGFNVPVQPVDWPRPSDRPRRLQINAFGFGGANYVAQFEECREAYGHVMPSRILPGKPDGRGEAKPEERPPVQGVSFFITQMAGRRCRLGVVAPSETEARTRVTNLAPVKPGDAFSKKSLRVMARNGLFAAPADEHINPLAFVFAGQGSQYVGMGKTLYQTFPGVRKWMDRVASAADFDLLDLLFNSREQDLQKTRWQQPALYALEIGMVQYLRSIGVTPAAMAGHSLGELVALGVAGVFSCEDGFRIVNKRAQCMDKACGLRGDPGTMLAVDAPKAYLEEKLNNLENVFYTNINSPRQVVIGGDTEPVLALAEEIKRDGHKATQLKVSMAFHSPIMKVIHDEMADFISGITFHRPGIPVVSNTTMAPYPDDPDQIREILMAHLESPVHWMQNVETLWNDFGVRCFVEIGPKDTLCGLVGETLEKALCIPTCMPEDEVYAYQAGMAHLYALGHLDQVPVLKATDCRPVSSRVADITIRPPSEDRVGAIVQREINAFVLESFGKIIKPQIVDAVRQELDPGFTSEHLHAMLEHSSPPLLLNEPAVSGENGVQPLARKTGQAPLPPSPPTTERDEEAVDYLEQVIQIIMEGTGYERDEIEPDMDLRKDLAIRSSRLPVLMDGFERRFNITIHVEDFLDKRTIREIADKIEALAGQDGRKTPVGEPLDPKAINTAGNSTPEDDPQKESLKRLTLEEAELPTGALVPLTLAPDQTVAVLGTVTGSSFAADLSLHLKKRFGARMLLMDCSSSGNGGKYDLRTAKGARNVVRQLETAPSLAGLVLVLEDDPKHALSGAEDTAAFLTGFFRCFQCLMHSKNKIFCLSLMRDVALHTSEAIAGEGVLGMLLAANLEYPSLLLRSATLGVGMDTENALNVILNTGNPVVQLICRDQKTFTLKAVNVPLALRCESRLKLGAGDVVVISGGAKGVTYRIARALAPFKIRVVLLGRTEMDPATAYSTLRKLGGYAKKTVAAYAGKPQGDTEKNLAALDIARNVSRLSALGLKASYHSCDVADPIKVAQTLDQVVKRYGRIDGIIHGAGIIRDSLMDSMTPDDFKRVMEVKFTGAWHLFRKSRKHGLRFFTGLSSIVAIQGNVGQVNYCAANRSLSALLYSMSATSPGLFTKVLMLPPIEGTGMAEDPEVKALMKLKGLESAFVHADELAQLFCRELFLGSPHPAGIMLARTFPTVKGTLVGPTKCDAETTRLCKGGTRFRQQEFPMIGIVEKLDLAEGTLVARRMFAPAVDLWLEDHKPFKFLKHALVSGIMAVETFLESARMLFPYLSVVGIRQLTFEDILECPRHMEREGRIICQHAEGLGQEVRCDVRLSSANLSPSGRILDNWSTNYQGQVILGMKTTSLQPWPDFAVRKDELDTRAMEPSEIEDIYDKRTGLKGRYRVLGKIYGSGPGVIKGRMVYREQDDIAGFDHVRYQYSPYLIEALMHLFAFYPALRPEAEDWNLIPASMKEMRFTRSAQNGETCTLEARLRSQNEQSFTWDARVLDDSGATILQVLSLRMNRFSL
ncbi:MAG: SDR family NAD(P)-dependent oxidoreductase [Deltaproteobacteria bacterium]|nr:SDR family NAD(P)-dependent oxidoreductase [Deltaproteobacteria bacterium]